MSPEKKLCATVEEGLAAGVAGEGVEGVLGLLHAGGDGEGGGSGEAEGAAGVGLRQIRRGSSEEMGEVVMLLVSPIVISMGLPESEL
jgi:hypothetical protein